MDIKTPYAFEKNSNELKYIKDVPTGLDCNCYCKTCGEALIAKNKGAIKKPHFAHINESKCNSRETLLHFLTKYLFSELNEIYLPIYESGWIFHFIPQLIEFPKHLKTNGYIESDGYYTALGQNYPIKHVRIEKKLDNIVPDVMATISIDNIDYEFLIEIAVTHFIDDKKKEYIKKNNLNCLEFDISHLKNLEELWDKEKVKNTVLKNAKITLINENCIKHDKLMLEYEMEVLSEGYVTNYGKEYALDETFFKDKKIWKEIQEKMSF